MGVLHEVRDHIGLVPVHDAGERQEEDLDRIRRGQHLGILRGV